MGGRKGVVLPPSVRTVCDVDRDVRSTIRCVPDHPCAHGYAKQTQLTRTSKITVANSNSDVWEKSQARRLFVGLATKVPHCYHNFIGSASEVMITASCILDKPLPTVYTIRTGLGKTQKLFQFQTTWLS